MSSIYPGTDSYKGHSRTLSYPVVPGGCQSHASTPIFIGFRRAPE